MPCWHCGGLLDGGGAVKVLAQGHERKCHATCAATVEKDERMSRLTAIPRMGRGLMAELDSMGMSLWFMAPKR